MAFDAQFKHGDPLMVDYTPVAAVPAGTVIAGVAGGILTVIAHHDLPAGEVGAVAAGGGVYEMVSLESSPNLTKVYWDPAAHKVTSVAGALAKFGYIVSGGLGGANSKVLVKHSPDG